MTDHYVGRHRPIRKRGPRAWGVGLVAGLALLTVPPISAAHKPVEVVERVVEPQPAFISAATIDERADLLAERKLADEKAAAARLAAAKAAAAQQEARQETKAAEKRKAERAARKAAKEAAAKRRAAQLAASHRWVRPISYYVLTSGYGWRWGKLHPAQDLAVPIGTPVRAMSSGKVIEAGWSNQGYGNIIKIRYWDGTVSWYAHNSKLIVKVGQKVNVGQTVAFSGNTGNSTGPHVHLEIHPRGQGSVPPAAWLRAKGIPL